MKNKPCLLRHSGQAMTEMLVASAFVLIPLFLIVPMLGKYIDMKQAVVSAARYSAWQTTIGESADSLQVAQRIYAEHDEPLSSAMGCKGRALWQYHNATPMINGDLKAGCQVDLKDDESIHDLTKDITLEGVEIAEVALKSISKITLGKFDVIDVNGRAVSLVSLSINAAPKYTALDNSSDNILLGKPLTMKAKGEVYASSWSNPDEDDVEENVKALVPTSIIAKGFDAFSVGNLKAQDALAAIMLSPELESTQLKFGIVSQNVLPRDKYLLPGSTTLRQYPENKPELCIGPDYCRE